MNSIVSPSARNRLQQIARDHEDEPLAGLILKHEVNRRVASLCALANDDDLLHFDVLDRMHCCRPVEPLLDGVVRVSADRQIEMVAKWVTMITPDALLCQAWQSSPTQRRGHGHDAGPRCR